MVIFHSYAKLPRFPSRDFIPGSWAPENCVFFCPGQSASTCFFFFYIHSERSSKYKMMTYRNFHIFSWLLQSYHWCEFQSSHWGSNGSASLHVAPRDPRSRSWCFCSVSTIVRSCYRSNEFHEETKKLDETCNFVPCTKSVAILVYVVLKHPPSCRTQHLDQWSLRIAKDWLILLGNPQVRSPSWRTAYCTWL